MVERILGESGKDVRSLIGDAAYLRKLDPARFTDERFGVPTVVDIISELEKPGRDPRPEFKTAAFKEGVEKITDLEPGMTLEGVVTNITNFGAFIDIGVHQDGLVHISQMADKFVKDPHQVVKTGELVKVKVMEVDVDRKRIALSMRLNDKPGEKVKREPSTSKDRPQRREGRKPQKKTQQQQSGGAMADALAQAFKKR